MEISHVARRRWEALWAGVRCAAAFATGIFVLAANYDVLRSFAIVALTLAGGWYSLKAMADRW